MFGVFLFNSESDTEDEATVCLAFLLSKRRKRKHNHWIHDVNKVRKFEGEFHILHRRLLNWPDKFFQYYRMSIAQFETLHSVLEDHISKLSTNLRDSISTHERLAVVIR